MRKLKKYECVICYPSIKSGGQLVECKLVYKSFARAKSDENSQDAIREFSKTHSGYQWCRLLKDTVTRL